MSIKICAKCEAEKDIDDFYNEKNKKNGKSPIFIVIKIVNLLVISIMLKVENLIKEIKQ